MDFADQKSGKLDRDLRKDKCAPTTNPLRVER